MSGGHETQGIARLAPDTIVVRRLHPERVRSGWQIRVVSHPKGARVHPVGIVALETVLEADPSGDEEAQSAVVDLDPSRSGLGHGPTIHGERLTIGEKGLDDDRWSEGIALDTGRID